MPDYLLDSTKKGRRFTIKLKGLGTHSAEEPQPIDENAVTFQDAVTNFFTNKEAASIGTKTVIEAFHEYLANQKAMKTNSSFTFDRFELLGHDVDPNDSDGVV